MDFVFAAALGLAISSSLLESAKVNGGFSLFLGFAVATLRRIFNSTSSEVDPHGDSLCF
jgi:hypothetical protein